MSANAPLSLDLSQIQAAHVPVACQDLRATLSFFLEQLQFKVVAIFPADSPTTAIISAYGLTLRLFEGEGRVAERLDLLCTDPDAVAQGRRELVAPNGLVIRWVHADPPMVLPPTQQELVLSLEGQGTTWSVGRAGMRYRDLLPARHGGAFIASQIRILEGGPVPDYVHYHKVRFQLIFCRKGWVRVVYEGQGEPFVMHAGDCVLQPPLIRHRVLESSAGAEVVEVGSPAQHITMADPRMDLPNAPLPADHDFSGQRFVRFQGAHASWNPWRIPGFEAADTGIARATSDLATVRVVRSTNQAVHQGQSHDSEFCFYFVLAGEARFAVGGQIHALRSDDSITVPGGMPYAIEAQSPVQFLEVMLPAEPTFWMQDVVEE
jgi:mannose-6-phosphate isomerase-like protein (cupin superfamily)